MSSAPATLLRDYSHAAFPGKPFPQGKARGEALAEGLRILAARYGVKFREPLHINAKGEFFLVVSNGTERDGPNDPCGQYGEGLAALIGKHGSRTGAIYYGYHHHREASAGWCWMNHFAIQAMLEDAAANS